MANNPAKIDLSAIMDDARFCGAYLYYLQLANSYISQIFFDSFSRGKNAAKLYNWLADNKASNTQINWKGARISTPVFNAIVPDKTTKKRTGYLDCFDIDFAKLLQNLARSSDEGIRNISTRFFKNLNFYHCIPRGEKNFLTDLDAMRKTRNMIMHISKPSPDPPVIGALGLPACKLGSKGRCNGVDRINNTGDYAPR